MGSIAYTVTATFPDAELREEYVRWLRSGHLGAVLQGGATQAEVVRVEDPAAPPSVQSRYVFPDRASYDRYVATVAPGLRAEGVRLFGDRGVRFERMLGTIL